MRREPDKEYLVVCLPAAKVRLLERTVKRLADLLEEIAEEWDEPEVLEGRAEGSQVRNIAQELEAARAKASGGQG